MTGRALPRFKRSFHANRRRNCAQSGRLRDVNQFRNRNIIRGEQMVMYQLRDGEMDPTKARRDDEATKQRAGRTRLGFTRPVDWL